MFLVPSIDYSITAACVKYFSIEPFTLVRASVRTGLKLHIKNPLELGVRSNRQCYCCDSLLSKTKYNFR